MTSKKEYLRDQFIKVLKAKPPTNSENITALMDRFEHDQLMINKYFRRDIRPATTKFDRTQLQVRNEDREEKQTKYDLMAHLKSAPSLLEDYANLDRKRLFLKASKNQHSTPQANPISKLTRVRKIRVPEEIPYFVKKEVLDDDSLLTIDGDYNPFGQVVLYFEEFTRGVAKYKQQIGRKLVRNLKISDQANAQKYNELFKVIMAMENNPYRIDTLVPFEQMVLDIPKIFSVGRQLVKQEQKKEELALKAKEKADYENAVNDIRTQNLNYFKKQEDRWVGSINFVRRGEIAEKGALFYEGNLANPEPASTPEHAKPVLQIEGSEYAGLSGNEKRQVHKFVYDNYAHKQTDGSSKVNADLEYYDQIERTINDKKSVRKMTFRKLQELKAELIVGRSNARTNNEWIRQLPKIESAFVRGK